MAFVQGGVRNATTKKALREAVKADPSEVVFYPTSVMGPQFSGPIANLPEGTKLTVVGPDPHTSRRWFATVEHKNGKLAVS